MRWMRRVTADAMQDDRIWQSGPTEDELLGLAGVHAHRQEYAPSRRLPAYELHDVALDPRAEIRHAHNSRRFICDCGRSHTWIRDEGTRFCRCGQLHTRQIGTAVVPRTKQQNMED